MATRRFETPLPFSAEVVRAWHESPGAFLRLQTPWEPAEVLETRGTVHEGDRLVIRVPPGLRWVAVHHALPDGFVDEMESGPFSSWRHAHRFVDDGNGGCVIHDEITFEPGFLGFMLDRKLPPMFAFRRHRLLADLARHAGRPRLRVLLAGASGLVGSALAAFLRTGGNEVVQLVRRAPGPGQIHWDPDAGVLDPSGIEGFDAVIALGGEGVGDGAWTEARKEALVQSRVRPTALLARTLGQLSAPPRVWLNASAVGFYGDRGDAVVDETSGAGAGFLAELCARWEDATRVAGALGGARTRVVPLRFGVVLSSLGGALPKMRTPFSLGLGGPIGDGRQFFPWIALDDAIYAMHHLLHDPTVTGPVNVVAPEATRQGELAATLGRVLGRPAVLPMPAFAVKLGFGQMGEEMLLRGQRVEPAVLKERFTWSFPTLERALAWELGRPLGGGGLGA